jgi:hypothetical protein
MLKSTELVSNWNDVELGATVGCVGAGTPGMLGKLLKVNEAGALTIGAVLVVVVAVVVVGMLTVGWKENLPKGDGTEGTENGLF